MSVPMRAHMRYAAVDLSTRILRFASAVFMQFIRPRTAAARRSFGWPGFV